MEKIRIYPKWLRLSVLVWVIGLFSIGAKGAVDGSIIEDGYLTYVVLSEEEKTVELKSCDVKYDSWVLSIPETIVWNDCEYTVISIGREACENCNFSVVNLPSTLKEIEPHAFYYCTSLKKIEIPDGVKTIDVGVFACCWNLASVKLPAGLEKIQGYAFKETALTSIEFPASLTGIGEYAFDD